MGNISINGLSINYEVTGPANGRPVVMLHGWGANLDSFAPLVPGLEEHFRVYRIDFPGFGKSDAPREVWGVEEYTAFFGEFVKANGIAEPILIAHSFGGRVAILYSSRNAVRKNILIDAAGVKPQRPLKYYIRIYSFKLYKRLLPIFIGRKRADEKIESYRKKAGSSDYNNASGIMRSILVKVVNEDLRHVMPLIKAPTLLIWGENDTATPLRDAKIMEKLIPDCGLALLKGAGHFSYLDKPYEANLIIDSFLEKDKA